MNELIFFINKVLINGVVIGSVYAMGAIGVTLIYAVLRFAHFAHAEFMTIAAFLAFTLTAAFPTLGPALGVPTALVLLPVVALLTALCAVGIDRLFYRPLRLAGVKTVTMVMASIGVTLMVQGLVRLFYGTSAHSLFVEDRKAIFRLDVSFENLGLEAVRRKIVFTEPQIWLLLITVIAVVALHLFLTRARMGKAMRAMSDNPDLARVSGIDTDRVVAVTWMIGGALAATAGVLLALDVSLKPDLAHHLLLPIFAAAIVGGVGQPYGAIAGGFLIGFAETLSVFNWAVLLRPFAWAFPEGWEIPMQWTLVSTEYKLTASFAILLLVLILRPTGLFKGKVT